MYELILMRHAKSDWSNAGLSDFDRPLNDRGLRTAPAMGKFLVEQGIAPTAILCSSANRARQTLDLVLPAFSQNPTVIHDSDLYLAPATQLCQQLSNLDADVLRVMLIGHNPGLSMLASYLSGGNLELPTAAVVRLNVKRQEGWSTALKPAHWEATGFWKPREVLK